MAEKWTVRFKLKRSLYGKFHQHLYVRFVLPRLGAHFVPVAVSEGHHIE